MSTSLLEGVLGIDRDRGALPEQIYAQIAKAIRGGRLRVGQDLPSSRMLAVALGVSRNTVNAAYELLRADGLLSIRAGVRPCVNAVEPPPGGSGRPDTAGLLLSRRGELLATDFRAGLDTRGSGDLEPGTPDGALFPADGWARFLRRAARRGYGDHAIYASTAGLPVLREALASYLAASRGLVATPEQVLIVPSIQAGLFLASQCLADPGHAAWHETPGYPGARAALESAGLDVQPMRVDADGADPASVQGRPPRIIYVTPSHQYPLSVRMTLPRRLQLLEIAQASRAFVFEDDYDSEFLWQGRAIAALQGISGGRNVIYFGTTAKSLLPGLRLAYMVVPTELASGFQRALRNSGALVNVHVQAAFADFIASGQYGAHLRRIARVYEARGRMLVDAVKDRLGGQVRVAMPSGGLQVTIGLSDGVDDAAISRTLSQRGLNIPPLSAYCLGHRQNGLVAGFSSITEVKAARFCDHMVTALGLT